MPPCIGGTYDVQIQIVFFNCQRTYACKLVLNYIHQDMEEKKSYNLRDDSPGFCWRWHYILYKNL